LRTMSTSLLEPKGGTTPGQSMRYMLRISRTYCHT
jgi:hypothetical protein